MKRWQKLTLALVLVVLVVLGLGRMLHARQARQAQTSASAPQATIATAVGISGATIHTATASSISPPCFFFRGCAAWRLRR